jgi:hypothetical protein
MMCHRGDGMRADPRAAQHWLRMVCNVCNAATLQRCNGETLQRCNGATLQRCNGETLQRCNAATVQRCNKCNAATMTAPLSFVRCAHCLPPSAESAGLSGFRPIAPPTGCAIGRRRRSAATCGRRRCSQRCCRSARPCTMCYSGYSAYSGYSGYSGCSGYSMLAALLQVSPFSVPCSAMLNSAQPCRSTHTTCPQPVVIRPRIEDCRPFPLPLRCALTPCSAALRLPVEESTAAAHLRCRRTARRRPRPTPTRRSTGISSLRQGGARAIWDTAPDGILCRVG